LNRRQGEGAGLALIIAFAAIGIGIVGWTIPQGSKFATKNSHPATLVTLNVGVQYRIGLTSKGLALTAPARIAVFGSLIGTNDGFVPGLLTVLVYLDTAIVTGFGSSTCSPAPRTDGFETTGIFWSTEYVGSFGIELGTTWIVTSPNIQFNTLNPGGTYFGCVDVIWQPLDGITVSQFSFFATSTIFLEGIRP